MSIRSISLPVLIAILAFGCFSQPRSAQAFFDPALTAALQQLIATVKEEGVRDRMNECVAILGTAECLAQVKEEAVSNSVNSGGGQARSLKDVIEMFRESLMDMETFTANKDAEVAATEMSHRSNLEKARANSDWNQDIKKMTAEIKDEFSNIEQIACEKASVNTFTNAADMMTKDIAIVLADERLKKTEADPNAKEPRTNKGRSDAAWKRFQYANAQGFTSSSGNDGANAELGVEDGPLVNADVNAALLIEGTAVSNSLDKRSNIKAAEAFIENVSSPSLNPIRADLIKNAGTPVAEVFSKARSYMAKQNLFDLGLIKILADRVPLNGDESRRYIDKLMERAGFKDDTLREEILGKGGTTKAGLELAVYQIRSRDPAAIIGDAVNDQEDIARATMISSMEHTALLFELIQTLQTTNAIMGAIGNVQLEATLGQDLNAALISISGR